MEPTTKIREWMVQVGGPRTAADIARAHPGCNIARSIAWLVGNGLIDVVGDGVYQAHDRWCRPVPVGGIARGPQYDPTPTPGRDKGAVDGPMPVSRLSVGGERIRKVRVARFGEILPGILRDIENGATMNQALTNAGRSPTRLSKVPRIYADQMRTAAREAIRSGKRKGNPFWFQPPKAEKEMRA